LKKLDLGQTIGILANLGVVAGIIFLAVEIRQNNALMQSEASIAYADMRRGSYRDLAEDTELLRTLLKATNGEELSQLEALSLDYYSRSLFVTWEWELGQYQEGILDVLNQSPDSRWRPSFNSNPFMRESWLKHKGTLSAEFVQYMEENIVNER